jgi:hypothetical protein
MRTTCTSAALAVLSCALAAHAERAPAPAAPQTRAAQKTPKLAPAAKLGPAGKDAGPPPKEGAEAPAAPPPGALQTAPATAPPPAPGAPAQGNAQPALQPGQQAQQVPPPKPTPVKQLGRFDLDLTPAAFAALPELRGCTLPVGQPSGHGECTLAPNEERLVKLHLAWDEGRPGGELIALRLVFDPATAPPLTELEWQLTRAWGAPSLEQLRREKEQKIFTLQWEDPEHRATLEAAAPYQQPSRAIAVVIERKPHALTGELATLRPRPFAGYRSRMVRRLDWEGAPHAVVWGTSLTPAQEAMGEASPAFATQRGYLGIFKMEAGPGKKRWKALWERTVGSDEEDNDTQRVLRVETRDVTGDGEADLFVELSCPTCAGSVSEVLVKTIRAGKLIDLFGRKDLFRAEVQVEKMGLLRIREPEGEDGITVTTYGYDRSRGAFVLSHEERRARSRGYVPAADP